MQTRTLKTVATLGFIVSALFWQVSVRGSDSIDFLLNASADTNFHKAASVAEKLPDKEIELTVLPPWELLHFLSKPPWGEEKNISRQPSWHMLKSKFRPSKLWQSKHEGWQEGVKQFHTARLVEWEKKKRLFLYPHPEKKYFRRLPPYSTENPLDAGAKLQIKKEEARQRLEEELFNLKVAIRCLQNRIGSVSGQRQKYLVVAQHFQDYQRQRSSKAVIGRQDAFFSYFDSQKWIDYFQAEFSQETVEKFLSEHCPQPPMSRLCSQQELDPTNLNHWMKLQIRRHRIVKKFKKGTDSPFKTVLAELVARHPRRDLETWTSLEKKWKAAVREYERLYKTFRSVLIEYEIAVSELAENKLFKSLPPKNDGIKRPEGLAIDLIEDGLCDADFLSVELFQRLESMTLKGNKIRGYKGPEVESVFLLTPAHSYNLGDQNFPLTYLDLSSNQIIDIRFLKWLCNLVHLDLSSNKLTGYLNIELICWPKLQWLSLEGNTLSNIQFESGEYELETLKLAGNKLFGSLQPFFPLKGLKALILSNNDYGVVSGQQRAELKQNLPNLDESQLGLEQEKT